MFNRILNWWVINDPLPQRADVVVVISYGATAENLTLTSHAVMLAAREIGFRYPEAQVLWGEFSKNPVSGTERLAKYIHLRLNHHRYVGEVSSTTDECQAIKKTMEVDGIGLEDIIVVAEGCHSRRAKKVWSYYFPKARICFQSLPPKEVADKQNPMIFQRRWWTWFLVNLILYPLYLGRGVWLMSKVNLSQPASK